MLTQAFVNKLRVIDYWDVQDFVVRGPVFSRITEDVMGWRINGSYIRELGQNGIAVFDIRYYSEELERYFKNSILGIDCSRREVFVLIAGSSWLRIWIKVRCEAHLFLKVLNRRILLTLAIWDLADHIPGTYASWTDVKLVKFVKKLFRGTAK